MKIISIISFWIGLLMCCISAYTLYQAYLVVADLGINGDISPSLVSRGDIMKLIITGVSFISVVLGMIGLTKKHAHRKQAFLGVVFSLLAVISFVFGPILFF